MIVKSETNLKVAKVTKVISNGGHIVTKVTKVKITKKIFYGV